jgi:hypothetical protein
MQVNETERDSLAVRDTGLLLQFPMRGILSAVACAGIAAACVRGGYRWGRRDLARTLRERANAGPNRWEQLRFDAIVDYQRRHVLAVDSIHAIGSVDSPRAQYQLRNVSGRAIAFAAGSIQLFDSDGIPVGGVAATVSEPLSPGQSVTGGATWKVPDALKTVVGGGSGAAYFWADYIRFGDDTVQSFGKPALDGTYVAAPSQSTSSAAK